jgi:hypothetical protein
MYLLAAILFALVVCWALYVARRVCQVNDRLRANLAGCTGYPISPSFRRPVIAPPKSVERPTVPLRYGKGRAAERLIVVEMVKSGQLVCHVLVDGVLHSSVVPS